MRLFIDDERDPPRTKLPWIVLRSWKEWVEFTEVLKTSKKPTFPELVSFDHDLGDTEFEMTGLNIAQDMIELDMNDEIRFPENFKFTVHSQNPVGAENIRLLLEGYFKFQANEDTRLAYKIIYKYAMENKQLLLNPEANTA